MDPRLAEIYGTNEDASDIEKTAAAELAEKLAGEDETDIDGMSDDEIEALAQEVLSADEGEAEQETEQETDEDGEKVASDKVAEADFLGRVMAHAYVNELKSIDVDGEEKVAAKGGGKVLKMLQGKGKALLRKGKALKGKGMAKAKEMGEKAKEMGGKAKKFGKRHGKAMAGAGAAGLAAGAAAGRMSKQSSALDTLATERALEILAENGVELEQEETGEEKQASKADILAQAVEARAMALLQAEGYEFEDGEDEGEE